MEQLKPRAAVAAWLAEVEHLLNAEHVIDDGEAPDVRTAIDRGDAA
ncbi:MAG: hypothetical protein ACYDD4_03550 [Acidimicrobiales bacterium]